MCITACLCVCEILRLGVYSCLLFLVFVCLSE